MKSWELKDKRQAKETERHRSAEADSPGMQLCDQINNNNKKKPSKEHHMKPEGR